VHITVCRTLMSSPWAAGVARCDPGRPGGFRACHEPPRDVGVLARSTRHVASTAPCHAEARLDSGWGRRAVRATLADARRSVDPPPPRPQFGDSCGPIVPKRRMAWICHRIRAPRPIAHARRGSGTDPGVSAIGCHLESTHAPKRAAHRATRSNWRWLAAERPQHGQSDGVVPVAPRVVDSAGSAGSADSADSARSAGSSSAGASSARSR
jgi:hypothetical protein